MSCGAKIVTICCYYSCFIPLEHDGCSGNYPFDVFGAFIPANTRFSCCFFFYLAIWRLSSVQFSKLLLPKASFLSTHTFIVLFRSFLSSLFLYWGERSPSVPDNFRLFVKYPCIYGTMNHQIMISSRYVFEVSDIYLRWGYILWRTLHISLVEGHALQCTLDWRLVSRAMWSKHSRNGREQFYITISNFSWGVGDKVSFLLFSASGHKASFIHFSRCTWLLNCRC